MSKARRITNANDEMDKIDKRLDEAIFDYIVVSQNMSGISPEQFEFAREHILVVFNKTIYKIQEGARALGRESASGGYQKGAQEAGGG